MLLYNRLRGALLCLIQALTRLKTLTYHRYEPALSVLNIRLYIYLITLFLFHVLPCKVSAQAAEPVASPSYRIPEGGLKIGDQIPEELWNLPLQVVNHPEGKETITLNDYRGKLIILDFWATWCIPCIKALPETDRIQRQFKKEVSVLMVNSTDPKEKLDFLFSHRTNPDGSKYIVPSIFGDRELVRLFQPQTIPHYVWVSPQGTVIAATLPDQLSRSNIKKILLGDTGNLKNKIKTVKPDPKTDLVSSSENLLHNNSKYRGKLAERKPIFPTKIGMMGDKGKYRKIYFINQPLLSIIRRCHFGINDISPNRVFLNGKQVNEYDSWENILDTALYCYELEISEPADLDSLYTLARSDIELFFGIKMDSLRRRTATWVLTLENSAKTPKSEGGISDSNILDKTVSEKYIHNGSIGILANLLNTIWEKPVIDETHYSEPIDLLLPADLKNIKELASYLSNQGFRLSQEIRYLNTLEIKTNDGKHR